MLTNIDIQSLKLVDRLELEIRPAMNVITGETGAGKSILLGALGLALGDRADSSLIPHNKNKTEINARFDLRSQPKALEWLRSRQLDDDEQCILRRIIQKEGPSRAFINGTPTTLSELKTFSQMLLDVHSQHEHQLLLKTSHQINLLDKYAGLEKQKERVSSVFERLQETKAELKEIESARVETLAKEQLLRYQLEELETLGLKRGETNSLESSYKELEKTAQNRKKIEQTLALINGEQDQNILSLINVVLKNLSEIDSEHLLQIKELFESSLIQVEEASKDLSTFLENFDESSLKLKEIEDRLGHIYEIARKHKAQPEELVDLYETIGKTLYGLDASEQSYLQLRKSYEKIKDEYFEEAVKLSSKRSEVSGSIEEKVTETLHSLGMSESIFKVEIVKDQVMTAEGTDKVEFLISTIPGDLPKSLNKIASGGELSRISLAIQVATVSGNDVPTIVFDEIDAGIGGPTAEVVGNLLKKLGHSTQVLCVTHLPQIAAKGETQYLVAKKQSDKELFTVVEELSAEERIKEIARMLGGVQETKQSLSYAKTLLEEDRNTTY
ncbi:MAG: DNA repair protein RecN [Pseudomonadota bacterium]|nr:DNA repair protein RecN [Pseudomonadota bacterium]